MLEIKGLKKAFGSLEVLKGVDLKVNQGDVVAILGPSGSGKTTMLRCVNFLEHADGGSLIFDGKEYPFHNISKKDIAAIRQKTAFVFQNYNLLPVLNVYENIVYPIEIDGGRTDTDFVKEIIHELGLQKK